jgi:hypothetical protein
MRAKGITMNPNELVARARNVLLTPRQEWPLIAAESDTAAGLYMRYVMVLAAIPAIAGFLKSSLIGTHIPLVGTVRIGIVAGVSGMIVQYVISLTVVYLLALILNALAGTFSAQKDNMQALKSAAYASTAGWIAGGLVVVPYLGWLLALAGGIYGIYLLYLGLPVTMKCPPEKAAGYTAITVVCAIVLNLVVGAIVGTVTGFGLNDAARGSGIEIKSDSGTLKIDGDKLEAFGKRMEAAGKKMEEAQKNGDPQAGMEAAGAALGAMLGGGEQVEALSPDQIKTFLPESLDGLPRADTSAERNKTLGIQASTARAQYHDAEGERTLKLEITDLGGAKGFAALASWAAQESEKETDSGYEHTYHDGDRIVQEQWNKNDSRGSYTLVIAQRFSVTLEGQASSMQELKDLVGGLDLAGLEALKKSGVKAAPG